MKVIKITLVIIALSLMAIQFIPNEMPENKPVNNNDDIIGSGLVPLEITGILKTSCYDCHSNQTRFPWYSKMAPSSWLLARDIKTGRKNLNFSQWNSYSKRKKISRLESIREEVTSGEMPLPKYTIIHRKARLNEKQISAISKWTDDLTNKILK